MVAWGQGAGRSGLQRALSKLLGVTERFSIVIVINGDLAYTLALTFTEMQNGHQSGMHIIAGKLVFFKCPSGHFTIFKDNIREDQISHGYKLTW